MAEVKYRGGAGSDQVLNTQPGAAGDLVGLNASKDLVLITPSSPKVKVFAFTFATAGLDTGVSVYTPAIGEVLLDAWIRVVVAFDGTTPKADIGTFVGGNDGLFAAAADPVVLSAVDVAYGGTGLAGGDGATTASLAGQSAVGATDRVVPATFTAVNTLKLVVSQTGAKGGTAIGGTAGSGLLYLVTAVPETL